MITKLYVYATNFLYDLRKDQDGVTAIEYGLIALAMAVLIVAAFFSGEGGFIDDLSDGFDDIGGAIDDAAGDL
ncbi:Flp family type IVb pilin [Vibrio agarivorans]|uniref:Flp family type IVb pilin n=1 Tax=Vibrio agarivorans TaxID=153622 RepID=A0ABT7XX88_9VIBR|nr:Flp family type IVb pilin [Vibrio agarivorans]MDN2480397.1 Flp family type IVb pilin [Vibrio agarivorans]